MIGKTVGHYRITAELGHGGMGEVFEAQDTRLGRPVAVKFLPERRAGDRAAVDRFFREARAASALNHPNIVTIHDVGEAETGHYIVMELIRGRTLRVLAAEGLSLGRLAELAQQVARALAAAHAAGIVHRDIKPENIMVRDDGYVKVLDFGLARVVATSSTDDATETVGTDPGMLLGTIRYMSPEQGRAENVGAASDMFSLGIVLYELAAGRHPFLADSQIGILNAILSQTPASPSRLRPELPAMLEALLLRMLEKDPRLRPAAAEVEATLGELGGAVPVRPVGLAPIIAVQRHTVGRRKELAELRAGFESAVGGRGLLLCAAAESGIGKTTLVEEFLASLTGCSIARGRCSERLAGSEAYLPFMEALESLLRGEGGESLSRVMKLVAPTWYVQISPLASEDSSLARVMAEAKAASQERLKRELSAFLQEASRLRPLVVFLDDLHWADVSTVDLLAYLGGRLESMRLLLIGAYRPSDLLAAKHPFLQVKLELQGHGVCREVSPEFLTRDDIDRYLALEFPEHRFPDELPALVHARTEGNALFMADLVRYLRDRGVIAQQEGRWTVAQPLATIEQELPESVRSMVQRKIDRLSDADRRLLVAASVQGHVFDSAVVAKAVGIPAAEVEERLENLDHVHAVVRLSGDRELPDSTLTLRYSFVHVLYQNALYASLTATRKASLSAAVAEALLGYYGEQASESAAELALLFEMARDFARASDFFLAAARKAGQLYANREAVALSQRAIANAEKLRGEARHSRVLAAAMQSAQLHQVLTRFEDAIADFDVAEKAAAEAANAEAQVDAICGKANCLTMMKRLPEVREHGSRALALARQAHCEAGAAVAEMVLAAERLCMGDFAAAEQHYNVAIPLSKQTGVLASGVQPFFFRAMQHSWRLEYQEAHQIIGSTLDKARQAGSCMFILTSLFGRALTLGNQGRLGEALQTYQEAMRLAELNDEKFVYARLPNCLGWLHREIQDVEAALRWDTDGVQLARQTCDAEAQANAHVNLGHSYLLLDEPARALEHLQNAQRLFDSDVWFRWVYNTRIQAQLATYWIARGDLKQAASHVATSLQIAEGSRSRKHWAWAHKLLGDIAALEDRVEDARRDYQAALGILSQHRCPTIEWRILLAAADLERRLHDDSAAGELRARARSVVEALADSLREDQHRKTLLASKAAREL